MNCEFRSLPWSQNTEATQSPPDSPEEEVPNLELLFGGPEAEKASRRGDTEPVTDDLQDVVDG